MVNYEFQSIVSRSVIARYEAIHALDSIHSRDWRADYRKKREKSKGKCGVFINTQTNSEKDSKNLQKKKTIAILEE